MIWAYLTASSACQLKLAMYECDLLWVLLLKYHYNMCEGHKHDMDMLNQPVEGCIVFPCAAARPVTVIAQITLN